MKKIVLALIFGTLIFLPLGKVSALDALCNQPVTNGHGDVVGYKSGWTKSGDNYTCQAKDSPCYNNGQATTSPICRQDAQQNYQVKSTDLVNSNPVAGPNGILQTVTNIMALLTGIIAVIMIIISGMQFITAGGNFAGQRAGDNPSKARKARANLVSASVGLAIVALSWTIVTFIIQHFVK